MPVGVRLERGALRWALLGSQCLSVSGACRLGALSVLSAECGAFVVHTPPALPTPASGLGHIIMDMHNMYNGMACAFSML